jgi:hypothetical protein
MERKLEGAEQELYVFTWHLGSSAEAISHNAETWTRLYWSLPKGIPGVIVRGKVSMVPAIAVTGLDGDESDNVDRLFQRRRTLGRA